MTTLHFLFLTLIGCVSGFYASSVGGGGLLSMPALLLSGMPLPIAIATHRAAGIFLEGVSTVRYIRDKAYGVRHAAVLGLFAAAGALFGSYTLSSVSDSVVHVALIIVCVGAGIAVIYKQEVQQFIATLESHHRVAQGVLVWLLGVYGGFLGFGFGTLIVAVLALSGLSFVQSAGTGRFIGLCVSVVAAAVFFAQGMIDLPAVLSLGVGYAIGAWFGAGTAVRFGERYVKTLLIVMSVVIVAQLCVELVFGDRVL